MCGNSFHGVQGFVEEEDVIFGESLRFKDFCSPGEGALVHATSVGRDVLGGSPSVSEGNAGQPG